jgi:hypothetical protein
MIVDPNVRRAEVIAEKVVMKYMGMKSTADVIEKIQSDYKKELDKAGLPEGLIAIHLDTGSGSVYIHQPAPATPRRGAACIN